MKQRCLFTEGSISLPEGYKEQTVNILISPTGNAVNISRDDKPADETFDDYVVCQKPLLQRSQKDWQLLEEKPSVLGRDGIHGYLISSRYRPNKKQASCRLFYNLATLMVTLRTFQ
ncbi:DUF1795 domain-containing protein [Providencia alcalifaciens]|uniref:DcrB-related protein n=1 Tax=Morganellaceae TaxID=1903414 RepID=UPI00044D0D93|nr:MULTISPECIES: DcrB-related protein [Morganellaceae]EUD06688.1 PF08786 domain protein [Providencia alcalifaciens R90-1475]MDF7339784.1 DUF1795 domain-containing protein [Proteus mirabilis]MTC52087.1 DUF1795 domain-containing protein [Providencia alcalifaciens]